MSDETKTDHLREAKLGTENAAEEMDRGNMERARYFFEAAGVHAQIAQAERTERLADLLEGSSYDGQLSVSVNGHVTSGSP